eukprot:m.336946 g.336946  ORF g.336946 m.336946 type:complete len:60 (+) comp18000_c0_seq1:116-295(+)
MARGNQRELARKKNAAKQAEKEKGRKDDGLTAAQRKERDAKALQEKAKKKAEAKAAGGK